MRLEGESRKGVATRLPGAVGPAAASADPGHRRASNNWDGNEIGTPDTDRAGVERAAADREGLDDAGGREEGEVESVASPSGNLRHGHPRRSWLTSRAIERRAGAYRARAVTTAPAPAAMAPEMTRSSVAAGRSRSTRGSPSPRTTSGDPEERTADREHERLEDNDPSEVPSVGPSDAQDRVLGAHRGQIPPRTRWGHPGRGAAPRARDPARPRGPPRAPQTDRCLRGAHVRDRGSFLGIAWGRSRRRRSWGGPRSSGPPRTTWSSPAPSRPVPERWSRPWPCTPPLAARWPARSARNAERCPCRRFPDGDATESTSPSSRPPASSRPSRSAAARRPPGSAQLGARSRCRPRCRWPRRWPGSAARCCWSDCSREPRRDSLPALPFEPHRSPEGS